MALDERVVVLGLEDLGGDRPDGELVELRRLDVLDDDLVQARQGLGAERLELLLLEVPVGQLPVALELSSSDESSASPISK